MPASPLAVLRMAAPGSPSLREFGAELEISAAAISLFELGQRRLAPAKLRGYAKLVGRSVAEVERRFLESKQAFHETQLREVRTALRSHGVTRKRSGRRSKSVA